MGLFRKARALVLGNTNSLLDKVIDENSVPVVEQYVRDLGNEVTTITQQAAIAKGSASAQQHKVDASEQYIKDKTADAELLLGDDDPTNDGDAEKIMAHVETCEHELEGLKTDLASLNETAQNLEQTREKMKAKYNEMLQKLTRLRSMDKATKAKEGAARAIQAVGDASNVANGASVDNIVERMEGRSVAADAVLNDAMGTITDSSDDAVAKARLKQRMAEMKARLAKPADAPAK